MKGEGPYRHNRTVFLESALGSAGFALLVIRMHK